MEYTGYFKDKNNNNLYTMKRDVLWTGSASSFAAQTISVPNMNKYDEIEVFFYNWIAEQYGRQSTKCPVANGNNVHLSFSINLYNGSTTTTCHFGARLGTLNTTNNTITWGVQHGAVVYVDNRNPSSSNDNDWGVPYKIVGYKYYE